MNDPAPEELASALGKLVALQAVPLPETSEAEEQRRMSRRALVGTSNLPTRALRLVESGVIKTDDAWGAKLEAIAARVRQRPRRGVCVCLYGESSRGKTVMATALAMREYIEHDRGVSYLTLMDLAEWYEEARTARDNPGAEHRSERAVTHALREPALLILDECGKGRDTDAFVQRLFNALNWRYADGADTFLISNHGKAEFEEWLGPSLVARCNETGGFVNFNWEGFRP